jgi:DinB superfamily
MTHERCEICGFDGARWTDVDAMLAVAGLAAQWRKAVSGITPEQLCKRPIPTMWSIAEYADHVREVLFGMGFLLDTAVAQPGADLGQSPTSPFDPNPRTIDIEVTLTGMEYEAGGLGVGLTALSGAQWSSAVTLDGNEVDPRWIVRHAVHDATHHLLDAEQLRTALDSHN